MMNWHIGTVGWGYDEWRGVFYPPKMASRQYLAHYARYFNGVELDSTFYGTPPVARVEKWAQTAPSNFIFCPKTPREITHDLRLQEPELMRQFVNVVSHFGDKLGVILIQLPPDFTTAELEGFKAFLAALPADRRYAIEFRHMSWHTEETAELLHRYNIAWVGADYIIMPKVVVPTADFAYIRFLGRHGRYQYKNKELRDPTADITIWLNEHITPYLDRWKDAYIFFNDDFAGYAPQSATRLKKMVGLPAELPEIPQQGTLF